jgi:hypothetical protein
MKVAYLFFAYKNPKLMRRIVDCLSSADSAFFVHIDAKSDIGDFLGLRAANVLFTEQRLPVYWAEFSGIRAMLLLIRQALAHADNYDYMVLLSGSEYPLKSSGYIHAFLESYRGSEFISLVKVPNLEAGKPLSRINTLRFPSERPVRQLAGKVLEKLGLAQRDHRKHLGNLEPYAGHTWWALSREACRHISDFTDHNPRVVRFFENTFAPEESYFHTILGNSAFKSRVRRNLIYEDWSALGGHPAMINEKHIATFTAQEKITVNDAYGPGEVLFARKFSDESLPMVERLEEAMPPVARHGIPPR